MARAASRRAERRSAGMVCALQAAAWFFLVSVGTASPHPSVAERRSVLEEAVRDTGKAPDARGWLERGRLLAEKGDFAAALRALDAASLPDPALEGLGGPREDGQPRRTDTSDPAGAGPDRPVIPEDACRGPGIPVRGKTALSEPGSPARGVMPRRHRCPIAPNPLPSESVACWRRCFSSPRSRRGRLWPAPRPSSPADHPGSTSTREPTRAVHGGLPASTTPPGRPGSPSSVTATATRRRRSASVRTRLRSTLRPGSARASRRPGSRVSCASTCGWCGTTARSST